MAAPPPPAAEARTPIIADMYDMFVAVGLILDPGASSAETTTPADDSGSRAHTPSPKLQSKLRAQQRSAFARFDEDGNGSIDAGEVARVFKASGYEVSPTEVDAVVKRFDVNGDGVIQFDEFVGTSAASGRALAN